MKKIVYLLAACTCYFIITSYYTGPGNAGYELTGAENGGGNQTNGGCSCHSLSATAAIAVAIELDSSGIPTTHYIGGMNYTVKLTGINNDTMSHPKFGFQIGSIVGSVPSAAPTNAGIWSSPYPANTHYAAPQTTNFYVGVVEHSIALSATTGNGGIGSTYVQTFNWQAPIAGTGSVSIWAILNAVNGNGYPGTGDNWDTSHVVINEWGSSVSVASLESNEFSLNIFPNPASTNLNITYTLEAISKVSLKLFDLNGSLVADSPEEIQYSGMKKINFSISELPEGMYMLKTAVNDKQHIKKIIVYH